MRPDPLVHQITINGEPLRLFDLEDRVVACLDYDHGIVFDNSAWRVASIYTVRKAHLDGYTLERETLESQFPKAAWEPVPIWLILQAGDQPRPK